MCSLSSVLFVLGRSPSLGGRGMRQILQDLDAKFDSLATLPSKLDALALKVAELEKRIAKNDLSNPRFTSVESTQAPNGSAVRFAAYEKPIDPVPPKQAPVANHKTIVGGTTTTCTHTTTTCTHTTVTGIHTTITGIHIRTAAVTKYVRSVATPAARRARIASRAISRVAIRATARSIRPCVVMAKSLSQ